MTDIRGVVLVRLEGSWSMTYGHDNNRQWKFVSSPTSGEEVDWVSIRSFFFSMKVYATARDTGIA